MISNLKKWNWQAFGFVMLIASLFFRTAVRIHIVDSFMIFYFAFVVPVSLLIAWLSRDK